VIMGNTMSAPIPLGYRGGARRRIIPHGCSDPHRSPHRPEGVCLGIGSQAVWKRFSTPITVKEPGVMDAGRATRLSYGLAVSASSGVNPGATPSDAERPERSPRRTMTPASPGDPREERFDTDDMYESRCACRF